MNSWKSAASAIIPYPYLVSSVERPSGASVGPMPTANNPAFTFPRASRLLKHAAYEQVYSSGKRHFSASFTAFYLLSPASEDRAPGARVGLTVGRVLGGAVDRNRMKRRMRNLVRIHLVELNAALRERGLSAEIVINPKKVCLIADHAKLSAELARAFSVIAAATPAVETKATESKP